MSDKNESRGLAPALLVFLVTALLDKGQLKMEINERMGTLITIALSVIFVVLGALLAAELSPQFFDAIAALAENWSTPNTGIALLDAIIPILIIVLGFVLVFGFVAAIIRLARFR